MHAVDDSNVQDLTNCVALALEVGMNLAARWSEALQEENGLSPLSFTLSQTLLVVFVDVFPGPFLTCGALICEPLQEFSPSRVDVAAL